jgi:hypothetical protein
VRIDSYRAVFAVERRIYRVDRLRLNPAGVPLRGIAYFLALALWALAVAKLPLVGLLVARLPWYARDVLVPALVASGLTTVRVDGRPFHLTAAAILRLWCGPRRLAGMRSAPKLGVRWAPGSLVVLPDGSDACLRSLRYTGPGTVRVRVACKLHEDPGPWPHGPMRRPTLRLRQREPGCPSSRATVVELAPGTRLETGR